MVCGVVPVRVGPVFGRVSVPAGRWYAGLDDVSWKEGKTVKFIVYDVLGRVLYDGESWPMARAALDSAVYKDVGCPRLVIFPDTAF